jgi:cytochrome c-type biogenesis protein CcmE
MQADDRYASPDAIDDTAAFDETAEQSGWRSHRIRLIILAGVIGLAVAYMVYAAFPGNALFFATVGEFVDDPLLQDGRTLRVAGALVTDTFRREDGSTVSRFALANKAPDVPGPMVGSPNMEASYVGVLPDLFFNPHSEIILEGHYDPESAVFQTDNILVKCPSKYQSLQDANPDLAPPAEYSGSAESNVGS